MTKPRPAKAPAALKPMPPFEELDVDTLRFRIFAQDVGAGVDRPLDVLAYFTDAVRSGYIPPDEILHWLADQFADYLDGGPKSPRLDERLGLAPGSGRSGPREARTRETVSVREQLYIARLALLDFAGFTKKAAVLSLNDGVPGILGPMEKRFGPYKAGSLATKASQWRVREDYFKAMARLKQLDTQLPLIERLRAASSGKSKRK